MESLRLLALQVARKSLIGLRDDWAPIFIARLNDHAFAKFIAIVAPKRNIPEGTATGKITEAHVVLFINHESVLDICVTDSCHRSINGGIAKFDKGKITILFSRGIAWFETRLIPRDNIIFSL